MCSIFMGSWFESHNIIGVGFIQFHGRTQICLRITRPEKMQYKFELKDIIIRGVGTGWEGWAFPLPVFGRPDYFFQVSINLNAHYLQVKYKGVKMRGHFWFVGS